MLKLQLLFLGHYLNCWILSAYSELFTHLEEYTEKKSTVLTILGEDGKGNRIQDNTVLLLYYVKSFSGAVSKYAESN